MARFSRLQDETASDYEGLREALRPRLRNLPAEDIEALFERANLSAEDVEGFFDTLKDIGNAVVSAAPAVLPVAGTVVGTVYGGPAGAAIGNKVGNLAGGAISQATGQPTASRSPAAPAQTANTQVASTLAPGAPAAGATATGAPTAGALPGAVPAAAQLMQIMFRPEVLQALLQMFLGQLGALNVQVGSTLVPVGAFTTLLGTLANQAQAQHTAANPTPGAGVPEYLLGLTGEAVGDPAIPEHRAERLYELLQESDEQQTYPRNRIHSRRRISAEAEDAGAIEGDDAVFYVELDTGLEQDAPEDALW